MILRTRAAFTLIELLVVISIIGLLSTIAMTSLSSARVKARDAKRGADIRQIITALNLYNDQYGCLPVTYGTACPGAGGYYETNAGSWDYSSQGGFMTFLQTSGIMPKVPVDPINNTTGDGTPAGSTAYRYYCYPGNGPTLAYVRESDGANVYPLFQGTSNEYVCK